eukprot:1178581-Prorocentrum_minimum.AAC.2
MSAWSAKDVHKVSELWNSLERLEFDSDARHSLRIVTGIIFDGLGELDEATCVVLFHCVLVLCLYKGVGYSENQRDYPKINV